MAEGVLVLVGTVKGAFVLRSDARREGFEVSGPHLAGQQVAALAFDGRNGRRRILAGAGDEFWGSAVRHSDDLGSTWSDSETKNVRFPDDADVALRRIWQVQPAGPSEPDVVYAGVEPAALFRSEDGGETFGLMRGLWDHPQRPDWQPGGGGLCLHTILPDPEDPRRLHVAVSTGGHYRSEDGGETWQARNVGIRADFIPEPDGPYPEFGQCVHKIARDPVRPNTLYLQNHGGLYRSDDRGDAWRDIADGVPSDFGFPMVTHPRATGTAYIIPLWDEARWVPEGACRVYRTRNAGGSWEPLSEGLPQSGAYLTVLRDGFCADALDPAGLYFGTRTGQVFGSADEGERWRLLAEYLPPILCVKAAVLE